VAEDVELAESVSIAMLTVLETLTPTERAVFVLREVFDVPYDEIAEAVGKSPAAVRQIAHRAREHVEARRPRMEVSRTEQQQVVERFLAAVTGGDLQGCWTSSRPTWCSWPTAAAQPVSVNPSLRSTAASGCASTTRSAARRPFTWRLRSHVSAPNGRRFSRRCVR
jgi:DNA-directed RNA polymerase sigma subunit (sigma70/sigma32)